MKKQVVIVFMISLLGNIVFAEETFEGFEIRVIRPRNYSKTGRVEVGFDGVSVTNQTFVYTFMGRFSLNYHFNNEWAFLLSSYYGISEDKAEKTELKKSFDIATLVTRTKFFVDGEIGWAPIYGKFQLGGGNLIYYDTHITVGPSFAGIEYLRDHCRVDLNLGAVTKSYPAVVVGAGQQYYLSQHSSLKWGIKNHLIFYNPLDGGCSDGESDTTTDLLQNVTLQFGYSVFI